MFRYDPFPVRFAYIPNPTSSTEMPGLQCVAERIARKELKLCNLGPDPSCCLGLCKLTSNNPSDLTSLNVQVVSCSILIEWPEHPLKGKRVELSAFKVQAPLRKPTDYGSQECHPDQNASHMNIS